MRNEYEITIAGTYIRNTKQNKGIQSVRFGLNDLSVPTSYYPSSMLPNTSGTINTGFRLYQSDQWVVEEQLTVSDIKSLLAWTSAGKMFSDGTYIGTYTLPADGSELVLSDTTLSGDAIDERHVTQVYTYIPDEYA